MKSPLIKLPPKVFLAALGIVAFLFLVNLCGVFALAWTGKPIPPELMKQFLGLGTMLGFGVAGAREGDGEEEENADGGNS